MDGEAEERAGHHQRHEAGDRVAQRRCRPPPMPRQQEARQCGGDAELEQRLGIGQLLRNQRLKRGGAEEHREAVAEPVLVDEPGQRQQERGTADERQRDHELEANAGTLDQAEPVARHRLEIARDEVALSESGDQRRDQRRAPQRATAGRAVAAQAAPRRDERGRDLDEDEGAQRRREAEGDDAEAGRRQAAARERRRIDAGQTDAREQPREERDDQRDDEAHHLARNPAMARATLSCSQKSVRWPQLLSTCSSSAPSGLA